MIELDLIKGLVLLNIRSERKKEEVLELLTEYFGSRVRAENYYMDLYKLVHPYGIDVSGNEKILEEVVMPYMKTKLCECGHGADKHMKDMICDECGCNEFVLD